MKSRHMQGLSWKIRADVREHNTGNMPMDLLVQYAQRKGDVCRRRHEEQQAEEARRAEARRERRETRPTPRKYVTAAVTVPAKVGKVPPGPSPRGKSRFGKPRNHNCLACNMRGLFCRECPRPDAATKALLRKAYEESKSKSAQENQRRPKMAVAAVGTSLGPHRSSPDCRRFRHRACLVTFRRCGGDTMWCPIETAAYDLEWKVGDLATTFFGSDGMSYG